MNQESENIKSSLQACDAIVNAMRCGVGKTMRDALEASNKAQIEQIRSYLPMMDSETRERAEKTIAGLEGA